MFNRKACPICGKKLFIVRHLLFSESAGLECPQCHSVLGHSKKVNILKLLLLILFIPIMANAYEGEYRILSGVVSIALVYGIIKLQLESEFVIKYKSEGR